MEPDWGLLILGILVGWNAGFHFRDTRKKRASQALGEIVFDRILEVNKGRKFVSPDWRVCRTIDLSTPEMGDLFIEVASVRADRFYKAP